MRRFVILDHDHPFAHFDLMLEEDGTLRTWRLHGAPTSIEPIRAEPLGDHRMAYLDYEGPLTGDRGRVARWDSGSYELIEDGVERISIRFDGSHFRGQGELISEGGNWTWFWRQG